MRVIPDGHKRALAALREEVREAVNAEFVDRLSEAGFMRRILIRMRMRWIVNRRVRQQARTRAPGDGLYLSH